MKGTVKMDKELIAILTVFNMKVNGRKVENMGKELLLILMEGDMKVNGRKG